MKFTLSTKPLIDALALGIVNSNVSKFYQKSNMAQLQGKGNQLIINLEANNIVTELRLKGSGEAQDTGIMFVDSLLLKQLVSTFEASTTTLEFSDGGLMLYNGKSKFVLPRTVDSDTDLALKTPQLPQYDTPAVDIKKADWKFIKENQMYAIAMSFIHPVYTRVYCGSDQSVIVGDFDNSLFTLSQKGNFGTTCLLSDTIVNLFNSLPEGAKLRQLGKSYLIEVTTDGFEYMTEFTPYYESDEGVGTYNAPIILEMMEHPAGGYAEVNTAAVNKFLSQADLLSTNSEDHIRLGVKGNQLFLKDKNVDCSVDIKSEETSDYFCDFKTSMLKSVWNNYSTESVNIAPMQQDGETVGIIVWSDEMTTVLAGIE